MLRASSNATGWPLVAASRYGALFFVAYEATLACRRALGASAASERVDFALALFANTEASGRRYSAASASALGTELPRRS